MLVVALVDDGTSKHRGVLGGEAYAVCIIQANTTLFPLLPCVNDCDSRTIKDADSEDSLVREDGWRLVKLSEFLTGGRTLHPVWHPEILFATSPNVPALRLTSTRSQSKHSKLG